MRNEQLLVGDPETLFCSAYGSDPEEVLPVEPQKVVELLRSILIAKLRMDLSESTPGALPGNPRIVNLHCELLKKARLRRTFTMQSSAFMRTLIRVEFNDLGFFYCILTIETSLCLRELLLQIGFRDAMGRFIGFDEMINQLSFGHGSLPLA